MSSPLAIGAVSAVLRNLLDNGMVEAGAALGATVAVSSVAPDTIDLDGASEPLRLNVFLYQATANPGWRNAGLPSRNAAGERISNAPLAIDLHYLVTAYAQADFQAEILLGYAMHLLHERPVLDRAAIRRALDPSPLDVSMLPPAFQALVASDLADQAELLKITPSPMTIDEMSKLWSALQSHYRPSAAYQVSVVLIEGRRPARSPLPVLSRGDVDPTTNRDRGVVVVPDLLPPVATLLDIEYEAQQTSARLGETVVVHGVRLDGTGPRIRLVHPLLAAPIEMAVAPSADGKRFSFVVPADAAAQSAWAAGVWRLSLFVTPPGSTRERQSNVVPFVLSPDAVIAADPALGLAAASATRAGVPPTVRVVLAARPQVLPQQRAILMLDAFEATAESRLVATDLLAFVYPDSLPPSPPAEPYRLRLRVDGIDSVLLDRSGPVPIFDPGQSLAVPA